MSLSAAPPRVLTIAGSDSGGGAGIQADLKTMTVLKTYGATVLTAVTAQNTLGVQDIHPVPPGSVAAQMDSVFADLRINTVKTGMLANAEIMGVVVEKIKQYRPEFLVVDPVMVATSGALLLEEEAVSVLRDSLMPLATLITPNLAEGRMLLGIDSNSPLTQEEVAREIVALGAEAVLVKGGHLPERDMARDILYDSDGPLEFTAPRFSDDCTHGTGCTYSAAIASHLAHGLELKEAVEEAKEFITEAIASGFRVGAGINPVNHLVNLMKSSSQKEGKEE